MNVKTKIFGAVAAPIAGLALLALAVDPGPAAAAGSHGQAQGGGAMGQGKMGGGMMGGGPMSRGMSGGRQGMMGRGQGMMGGGQGMMGQGTMGNMMKMMLGSMGQRIMGRSMRGQGMRVVPSLNVTVKDVRLFMEKRLELVGNKRLKVGPVKQVGERIITADIVTVDNSLVRRFEIDRNTGWVKKAK